MDCGPCDSGSSQPKIYYQQAMPAVGKNYYQQAMPAVVYRQPADTYYPTNCNPCPPVDVCNPCPPVKVVNPCPPVNWCNPCPPVDWCNPCLPGGPEFFNFCVATLNTNPEEKDPHPAQYPLRNIVLGVKAILVVNVATE